MNYKNKIDFRNKPILQKILVVIFLFSFCIWGVISSVNAIIKFENYFHPYLFAFCFGTLGLLFGIFAAKKLRRVFTVTKKLYLDYGGAILIVSIGSIGTFLLIGQNLNQQLSYVEKCDNYEIVDKYYFEGSRNSGATRIVLYVEMNGKIEKLLCKLSYWQTVYKGQKIKICKYKSKMGFDYLQLPKEK